MYLWTTTKTILIQQSQIIYLLHHLHVLHEDLDSWEHNRRIGMGQARGDTLADGLRFALVLGIVVGERIQDEDLKDRRTDPDRLCEFKSTKKSGRSETQRP